MIANLNKTITIDGFIISQNLYNQITADTLFGISKKDDTHLGHDDIKWAINSDIICNGCNICDSCQGDCHSSCQGTCTSGCQGSCHSSCQGGCTSKCQGCAGCYSGCTSGCNNGCYSGCTGKCVGCHSCNECQTCVGATCVSCNGSCTGLVQCITTFNPDDCPGCYLRVQIGSCSSCVNGQGCGGGQVKSTKPTVVQHITDVVCSCFGCQNTVAGNEGCGNDYGYNTPNTILVYIEGSDEPITLEVKGEEIVAGGGSNRHAGDLADVIREFTQSSLKGYKIDKNTKLTLTTENGGTSETTTWGNLSAAGTTGQYINICYSNTGYSLPICATVTGIGCGVFTGGDQSCTQITLPDMTMPICQLGTGLF